MESRIAIEGPELVVIDFHEVLKVFFFKRIIL